MKLETAVVASFLQAFFFTTMTRLRMELVTLLAALLSTLIVALLEASLAVLMI